MVGDALGMVRSPNARWSYPGSAAAAPGWPFLHPDKKAPSLPIIVQVTDLAAHRFRKSQAQPGLDATYDNLRLLQYDGRGD